MRDGSSGGVEDELDSTTEGPISRWWVGVAVSFLASIIYFSGGQIAYFLGGEGFVGDDMFAMVMLVAVLLLIPSLLVLPVAVYVDTRQIRESDADWSPTPLLWTMFSLIATVSFPLSFTSFPISFRTTVPVVCGIYIFRRFTAIGFR